jgi:polynucleotide 5'-kinase involved in rRNA processing
MEARQLDKKSAAVFANLIKEESYPQFEARAMLLGEKGTGKTTVARFLVGKGPTKVRISTEGIDLYTALAFIDRETDEWLNGKQG